MDNPENKAGEEPVNMMGEEAGSKKKLSAEETKKRQRNRSIAIALALAGLVVLFYVVTLVRLGSNVMNRPL